MQTGTALNGLQERALLSQPDPTLSASSWELWALIGVILIMADILLRVRVTTPLAVSALLMAALLFASPAVAEVSIPAWLGSALIIWLGDRLFRRFIRNG
jgi:hypothetical protein